ncbi:flagellin [Paenalcaligenes hominis]|uniref:flagellin n=1 Tax=Paenalcaligenes hominis TaxID=643674 RepID=UPI0035256741
MNSAKDDAAGQAIANRMTAQIKGMNQAARNANDGISLLQTQESGLGEINGNLQRIRELAVQARSDTNTADDRASIQTEIDERIEEISRTVETSKFNGTSLLKNTVATLNIQVGANTSDDDSIALSTFDGETLVTALEGLADITDAATAKLAIDAVDGQIKIVDTTRSEIGAKQNRFESTITNLNSTINNLSAARSRIEDSDYAVEVSNMTRAQILQQAGTSVLAQANQVPQGVLSLLR